MDVSRLDSHNLPIFVSLVFVTWLSIVTVCPTDMIVVIMCQFNRAILKTLTSQD